MTIDITVIVPFLNEETFIRRCLESLLVCDYPEDRVEFLFVDNGSSDAGARIVREYPRVTLLSETGGKVFTARNTGIARARGKAIAFTDADCEVGREWLRTVHETILDDGATFALGAVGFARPLSELLGLIEIFRNDQIEYAITNRIWNHVFGYTNNMAVRADVFERLGPFKEVPVPGDTEIIHRSLLSDPSTRIVFRRDMWIEHLELVGMRILLRKILIYGGWETHMPDMRRLPSGCHKLPEFIAYTAGRNDFSLRQRLKLRYGAFIIDRFFKAGVRLERLRRALGRFKGGRR